MKVTFHGVRGSIPTPGPSTQRYGGNTVCAEVRTSDDTLIIMDGGTGIRDLGKKLITEDYRRDMHLFLTHQHWDHIIGIPFFAPLYRKDSVVLLHPYTVAGYNAAQRPVLFDGIHFPVRFEDIPARFDALEVQLEKTLRLGSASITHIALNHPGGASGFRIDDDDGSSFCYLTDNELSPPGPVTTTPSALARFAHGASLMIHDAQYLPSDMPAKKGWGHSLVGEVLALAKEAEVRTLALYHHEPERDDDALDRIAADAATWAGQFGAGLEVVVAREGQTFALAGR